MQEQATLLRANASQEDAVRAFRCDCISRLADRAAGSLAAASRAKSRLLSDPTVVSAALLGGRLAFLYDFASDGLVAKALMDGGNPVWGFVVLAIMVVPYIIMVAALCPIVSHKLANASGLPGTVTAVFWVLGGIPACAIADIYLNARYLCSDPAHVQEFHYMTLRGMAELLEAQLQLLLQSYVGLRQWNPGGLLPQVTGAHVNPYLLGSSIALSAYTTYETYAKIRFFAENQSGGNKWRFLQRMCHLGEGLLPSNLFTLVKSRQCVVISYDLRGASKKEMERLGIATKRARQLEELIFEDAGWVQALLGPTVSEEVAGYTIRDFASAPNLRLLELRGSEVPAWAVVQVTLVARSHRSLREARLEGHDPIQGAFASSLATAHPLLRAAQRGDLAAVRAAGGAAAIDVRAAALALAAYSDSVEVLRGLLLHARALEAINSLVGPHLGLDFAGDGALPLHFAAAGNSPHGVELLVLADADVNCRYASGFTPLHVAAREDCSEALQALVVAGASVEERITIGATASLLAAQQNSVACVQLLLTAQADASSQTDNGDTPVVMAAQNDSAASLQLLLQAHGDPNLAKSDGATPVYAAAQTDSVECLTLLLKAKADMNLTTLAGSTPVLAATNSNAVDSLRLLLMNRADPNKPDNDGNVPAVVAAWRNYPESLRLLSTWRADINQADGNGRAPLIAAAGRGAAECLRLLIQIRADPGATWRSATPLEWAQQQGHEAAVAVLREGPAPD